MAAPLVTCLPAAVAAGLRPVIDGPVQSGAVVGRFPAARYALLDDGSVLALLMPDALRLPCGVIVPELPDGPVTVGAGRLTVGSVVLEVRRYWSASVGRLDPPRPQAVREIGEDCAHPSGEIRPDLLLGRGDGLTPAGDDILAGYLVTCAAYGIDCAATRDAVATLAPSRTTALSLTLLRHAANGEAIPQVVRLLRAMSRDEDVPACLGELHRVGHSSGRALAAGVHWAALRMVR